MVAQKGLTMNFKYFIGIDPGKSGAIASIDNDNNVIFIKKIDKKKIYNNDKIVYSAFIEELSFLKDIQEPDKTFVMIEDVHAMPKQGVVSTFNFGYIKGLLLGFIMSIIKDVDSEEPSVWKRRFGVNKNKSLCKAVALKLFPEISEDLTYDEYEALLLAYFAKEVKQYEYKLKKEGKRNYENSKT